MDHTRLARIEAGAGERTRRGSGLLVAPNLVLTAAHNVLGRDGRPLTRVHCRIGDPGTHVAGPLACEVAWHGRGTFDAALLRVTDPAWRPVDRAAWAPTRWGRFTGRAEVPGCAAVGFPAHQGPASTDQFTAAYVPGARLGGGEDVYRTAAPVPNADWRGMSGAAVHAGPLLTGVITREDTGRGGGTLHAVPLWRLLADPGFAAAITEDAGTAPVWEAVEPAALFVPATRRAPVGSPGALLRADVAAVPFDLDGRRDELAALEEWRDAPHVHGVHLVTGEGGQGKSRLANEFIARSRDAGWISGYADLRAGASAEAAYAALPASALPVLVVVDYAESVPAIGAGGLIERLLAEDARTRIRVLLLAREAGSWWNGLAMTLGERHAPAPATHTGLPALHPEPDAAAFTAAVEAFRTRLPELPALSTVDWAAVRVPVPALTRSAHGNALGIQTAALTALLDAARPHPDADCGPGAGAGEEPEADLYRHEMRYADALAAPYGFDRRGWLTRSPDPAARVAEERVARRILLTAFVLLAPRTMDELRRCIGLGTDDGELIDAAASWLVKLYPPAPGDDAAVGTVQPDRLAEHLVARHLTEGMLDRLVRELRGTGPRLVFEIGERGLGRDALSQLLTILERAAKGRSRAALATAVAGRIVAHPLALGLPAMAIASHIGGASALKDGLAALAKARPREFHDYVARLPLQLPDEPAFMARLARATGDLLVEIYRPLAAADPAVYRAPYAEALLNLNRRLRDPHAALAVSTELLAEVDALGEPGALQPALRIAAVVMHANNLIRTGDPLAAIGFCHQAAELNERFGDAAVVRGFDPLASVLISLSSALHAAGRPAEALEASAEAVELSRRMRAASVGEVSHVAALHQHTEALLDAGRAGDALPFSTELVECARANAEDVSNEEHLDRYAACLHLHARVLAAADRPAEAVRAMAECRDRYRDLLRHDHKRFLPLLARALAVYGHHLGALDEHDLAFEAVDESVRLLRASPEPEHAGHLLNALYVRSLIRVSGRAPVAAVDCFVEWLEVAERLHPGEVRDGDVLAMAHSLDPDAVEARWTELTGTPWPLPGE